MVTFNGYNIQLTRGDSLHIRVDLAGRDLPPGTEAVLTVKKNIFTDETVIRKRFDASAEVVNLVLTPEETGIRPGVYVWDLRLHIPQPDGSFEMCTPMEYAAFAVRETVGNQATGEAEAAPCLPMLQLALTEANAAIARANAAAENANLAASEAKGYVVPAFWAEEVEAAVSAVRAHQDACGAQGVCFALCADMHVGGNDQNYARNLGMLAAAVMDRADVPVLVSCGDLLTGDSVAQEQELKACYDRAWKYLSPVQDRLLLLQGDHDGTWGASAAQNPAAAHSKNVSPDKLWQYLFRPQTMSRVYGPGYTYFYTDLAAQKTRFICLNSHDGQWSENADGTAVWNTMKGGYTQSQLDWLAQEALNVEEGWCILMYSHVPPTNKMITDYSGVRGTALLRGMMSAYVNRTSYSGSYTHNAENGEGTWANLSVSVNFAGAKGEIAGWFCGHAHRDAIVMQDLPFPIISITSAADVSYSVVEADRTLDSDTETALDVVTVDRRSRTIYMTRLGVGEDRSCSYADTTVPPEPDIPSIMSVEATE